MAHQYASKQPAGFKNHVENIAIVGVNGSVGKFITEALLVAGKHKITALTRADSPNKVPDGVVAKEIIYDKQSSIVEALKGQDVLIITLGVMVPPDTQAKLVDAAAAAGVALVLPNEWGFDRQFPLDGVLGSMNEKSQQIRKHIDSLGMSWIGVICGFWYEFSLAGSASRYGFDFNNKKLIYFDDGTTKINTSSWPQCGKAVANLLALKVLPEDESDKSFNLAQFKNNFVRISSFLVSQTDMFESVLRCTKTKESNWQISHENSKERYEAGVKMMQEGKREGFGQLMYTRMFFPDGCGDFETRMGLQNEALGLTSEDIDPYTKIAVEVAREGTKY